MRTCHGTTVLAKAENVVLACSGRVRMLALRWWGNAKISVVVRHGYGQGGALAMAEPALHQTPSHVPCLATLGGVSLCGPLLSCPSYTFVILFSIARFCYSLPSMARHFLATQLLSLLFPSLFSSLFSSRCCNRLCFRGTSRAHGTQ